MSANEKMTKLEGKEKSVDFVKKVSTKFEKIKSETCIRPRFASHTLSSLMKTRTPINLKKSSSLMRSARTSKRSQKGLLYNRPNGIYKRRSIAKQNKNMQALITILKWEKKDYRASVSLSHQDNELTGTVSECVENSLVFLSSDLIKDISQDLKKCTASPAKLVVPRGEPAKVVDQPEKHVEDSHTLLQEKMGHMDLSLCQNNSENIRDNVKNCTIADIARQSQSDDEEKNCANSSHKIEVPHCKLGLSEPEEKLEENEDCTAIETLVPQQNASTSVKDYTSEHQILRKYALRRGNWKTWTSRKAETKHVDIDRAYNVNLQDSRNCKFMKHNNNSRDKDDKSVVNCNVPTTKKGAFKKSLIFTNQQVWRPPGVTKSSIIKSTMSSTQPMSQKSSRSTKRSIVSVENKHSSVKPVELSSESTNTSISVDQMMKENRDPRANRVTETFKHLAETKQQQRPQSRGALPKRRRWSTKVDSTTSNNRNDANPKKSRSRQWHTVTPRESSQNWSEQSRIESAVICNRRSRSSEIITTLKEIINNVKIDEDVEENAYNVSNDVFNNKESDSGLQTLSNCDASTEMSQADEADSIKNKHFDKPNQSFDQSFWKSISTQTERDLELTKILKFTQIATQSSPSCNNVVETGCNTSHYNAICKDVGVSCDLIDSTNSKTDIDLTAIEDKTLTLENVPVHTEFITHTENEEKVEYSDRNKDFPISKCKQTLSTEMTLELEDYDIMETPAKKTNNVTTDEEKIIYESFQTFLKLSKDSDDKTNIEEFLEEIVEHKDTVMSELKVEKIPSDVIAAFELAKQRAYNLRKAISIYYDNLMPEITDQVIPERTDKIIDENSQRFSELSENSDDKTNIDIDTHRTFDTDYNYLAENLFTERYPLPSPAIYNYRPWTSEEIAEFVEDIDKSSTCSSESSNSIQTPFEGDVSSYQLPLRTYCELVNKKEIKSLSELLMEGIKREEDKFKVLQSLNNKNDNEDFEAAGAIETLALPTSVEEILSIISLKNLSSLIYFIFGVIVLWCFQVLFFKCDSAT